MTKNLTWSRFNLSTNNWVSLWKVLLILWVRELEAHEQNIIGITTSYLRNLDQQSFSKKQSTNPNECKKTKQTDLMPQSCPTFYILLTDLCVDWAPREPSIISDRALYFSVCAFWSSSRRVWCVSSPGADEEGEACGGHLEGLELSHTSSTTNCSVSTLDCRDEGMRVCLWETERASGRGDGGRRKGEIGEMEDRWKWMGPDKKKGEVRIQREQTLIWL